MRRAGFVVLASLAASSVWAQAQEHDGEVDPTTRAAELAAQADAKAKASDFVGAAALFKQAYALDPKAEYGCNIGIAYYKAKELPRAQLFLGVCLTRGSHLPERFTKQVRTALGTVEDKLRKGEFAPVDVVVTPASAEVRVSVFAPDETFVGSRTVWLPFGAHTLEVSAAGHVTEALAVELRSRERFAAKVDLEPTPVVIEAPDAGVVEVPDAAPQLAVVDAAVEAPVAPSPVVEAPSRLPAYIATGATIVVAGVTFVAYGRAADAADHAGTMIAGDGYDDAVADAERKRTIAYAGYAVTAIAAVTSGYLWWRVIRTPEGRTPEGRVMVSPGVTPDGAGAGVWLSGSF